MSRPARSNASGRPPVAAYAAPRPQPRRTSVAVPAPAQIYYYLRPGYWQYRFRDCRRPGDILPGRLFEAIDWQRRAAAALFQGAPPIPTRKTAGAAVMDKDFAHLLLELNRKPAVGADNQLLLGPTQANSRKRKCAPTGGGNPRTAKSGRPKSGQAKRQPKPARVAAAPAAPAAEEIPMLVPVAPDETVILLTSPLHPS